MNAPSNEASAGRAGTRPASPSAGSRAVAAETAAPSRRGSPGADFARSPPRLLPARRHAVLHGWPDDEGNAVEVVRALLPPISRNHLLAVDRHRLFRAPVSPRPSWRRRTGDPRAARLAPRGGARAYRRVTFFTHGLFTAGRAPGEQARRQSVAWRRPNSPQARINSLDVVVAGTLLWGRQRQQRFALPESAVAVVGNPRVDQFHATPRGRAWPAWARSRQADRSLAAHIRAASAPHGRSGREADDLSSNADLLSRPVLTTTSAAHSLQLLVKPHPWTPTRTMASVSQRFPRGAQRGGSHLYQLLGAVDRVISDVSSGPGSTILRWTARSGLRPRLETFSAGGS